jgi:hypothetical protein
MDAGGCRALLVGWAGAWLWAWLRAGVVASVRASVRACLRLPITGGQVARLQLLPLVCAATVGTFAVVAAPSAVVVHVCSVQADFDQAFLPADSWRVSEGTCVLARGLPRLPPSGVHTTYCAAAVE